MVHRIKWRMKLKNETIVKESKKREKLSCTAHTCKHIHTTKICSLMWNHESNFSNHLIIWIQSNQFHHPTALQRIVLLWVCIHISFFIFDGENRKQFKFDKCAMFIEINLPISLTTKSYWKTYKQKPIVQIYMRWKFIWFSDN